MAGLSTAAAFKAAGLKTGRAKFPATDRKVSGVSKRGAKSRG